ncbi:MAG: hypothetical protein H3C43_08350, partial [Leptonema sp. (in: Bacteria)]|nr:hypothetical protein [Leptonema sp. (in: bacteria)]
MKNNEKKLTKGLESSLPTDQELLIVDALADLSNVSEIDEAQIPKLYHEFVENQNSRNLDNEIQSIIELRSVIDKYEFSKKPFFQLPEALESAVDRYFKAEQKSQKKARHGSLILKLGAGLEMISSTLSGLEPVFVTVAQTRRSGDDQQRLSMKEPIKGGGLIEYSILRSTEDTVMVTLLFQELHQPLTVKLSENGRTISSQTVSDESGRIHFDGL